jgi:hypothetical protein
MRLQTTDLSALKVPLAAVAAAALAGGALVYMTTRMIADEKRQVAAQETRLKEARSRYQRSGDERDVIMRYIGPYKELHSHGLIGPEQRINWLDAMRVANQETRIFGAEYQISVQQPYEHARELNALGLGLAQSVMKLNLRIAHEGELMRFLRTLAQQRAGTFDINQCMLERIGGVPAPGAPPRMQPNLRAECELAWITINPEPSAERRP